MFYNEEIVEEVRTRSNIVNIVSQYVNLKKKGSSYQGLCPFHNEKTPSFSVSEPKQMFYCFGCGVGGNVFSFLMQYENLTFREALKQLASQAGISLPEQVYSEEEKRKFNEIENLREMNKIAAKAFYSYLRTPNGENAMRYLKNRGLTDEIINQFALGFSPMGGKNIYQLLKKYNYTDGQIKDSGLVKIDERGAYDRFWNRVMFPILDANGKVIGFGGRVMGDGEPKYLNSPETKLFDKSKNLYGLHIARKTRKDYFIICEGYMDVIALHQAGFTNAIASLGTAFTAGHGVILRRYTKKVILSFDGDKAGIKAAIRSLAILREIGLQARVLNMNPYKDPDDFIKHEGAEAYQKRIDEAEDSFMFEIRTLYEEADMTQPANKASFYQEVARRLLNFEEALERDAYIESVCKTYQIDRANLKSMIVKLSRSLDTQVSAYEKPKSLKKTKSQDGTKVLEQVILTWMGEEKSVIESVKRYIEPEDFTHPICQKIATLIWGEKEELINPGKILNAFIESEEEYTEAASAFNAKVKNSEGELVPISELSKEEKKKVFSDTIRRIRKASLEKKASKVTNINELQAIAQQIKECDSKEVPYLLHTKE